jgi:hypothetical protein
MTLAGFEVDEAPHNMDGLLLHAWDESERVEAFTSRRVMDRWVAPRQPYRTGRSLLRAQYNALGKLNLAAIERIAVSKYQRGKAFNRQHPFVDILLSDITESDETLDTSELVREPLGPLSNGCRVRRVTVPTYRTATALNTPRPVPRVPRSLILSGTRLNLARGRIREERVSVGWSATSEAQPKI